MINKFKLLTLSATCLGAALLFTGCDVDEGDVTAARQDVAEEQQETMETRNEANREINEKEKELADARHKAMRPNYDEQEEVAEKARELAVTKRDANEKVEEEEKETREAKAEAQRVERELAAKKARDAYVTDVEAKLEEVDNRIATMKEKLENLEGTAHEEMETSIELMEVKRESLSDALSAVKNAELTEWEMEKTKVEKALERINE